MNARTIAAALCVALIAAASPAVAQTPPAPVPAPAEPSCADDPLFQQQDFTVGHWDVFNEKGAKQAEVKMDRAMDGCAIWETWLSPDGAKTTGLGLFNYSRILKAWSYAWVSSRGASTLFQGQLLAPGTMRFITTRPGANGATRLRHWSLIANPDGTVRELAVGSEDGEKTWTTEYDLKWVKKAPQ